MSIVYLLCRTNLFLKSNSDIWPTTVGGDLQSIRTCRQLQWTVVYILCRHGCRPSLMHVMSGRVACGVWHDEYLHGEHVDIGSWYGGGLMWPIVVGAIKYSRLSAECARLKVLDPFGLYQIPYLYPLTASNIYSYHEPVLHLCVLWCVIFLRHRELLDLVKKNVVQRRFGHFSQNCLNDIWSIGWRATGNVSHALLHLYNNDLESIQ